MFLASRRADERALKVPKHALSIFLMMLPLATAIFDSTKTKEASSSQSSLVRLTAEQKRKVTTDNTSRAGNEETKISTID